MGFRFWERLGNRKAEFLAKSGGIRKRKISEIFLFFKEPFLQKFTTKLVNKNYFSQRLNNILLNKNLINFKNLEVIFWKTKISGPWIITKLGIPVSPWCVCSSCARVRTCVCVCVSLCLWIISEVVRSKKCKTFIFGTIYSTFSFSWPFRPASAFSSAQTSISSLKPATWRTRRRLPSHEWEWSTWSGLDGRIGARGENVCLTWPHDTHT